VGQNTGCHTSRTETATGYQEPLRSCCRTRPWLRTGGETATATGGRDASRDSDQLGKAARPDWEHEEVLSAQVGKQKDRKIRIQAAARFHAAAVYPSLRVIVYSYLYAPDQFVTDLTEYLSLRISLLAACAERYQTDEDQY
jgi:hypothetical protein